MTDIDDIVHAVAVLLRERGYQIVTGIEGQAPLPETLLSQPHCLLPVLLRLGEELWRAKTGGSGFGLALQADKDAYTGYRVIGLYHVPLSIALLAVDEVLRRAAAGGTPIPIDTLGASTAGGASLA